MNVITTMSEEQTQAVARELAATLTRGDVVALTGDLGTGKTRFVRGVCSAFGIESVSSPTFVLLNRYTGADASGAELLVYHLDLYRISSLTEIYDLGYEEVIGGDGICLIEWAEVLDGLLPPRRYDVHLEYGERETERTIRIDCVSAPNKSGESAVQGNRTA